MISKKLWTKKGNSTDDSSTATGRAKVPNVSAQRPDSDVRQLLTAKLNAVSEG